MLCTKGALHTYQHSAELNTLRSQECLYNSQNDDVLGQVRHAEVSFQEDLNDDKLRNRKSTDKLKHNIGGSTGRNANCHALRDNGEASNMHKFKAFQVQYICTQHIGLMLWVCILLLLLRTNTQQEQAKLA